MTDTHKETEFKNRLLRLFDGIQRSDLVKKQRNRNEMPYTIFDYPPEYELIFRQILEEKTAKNNADEGAHPILVLDLYQLIIEILEEKSGYLERCFKIEERGFGHVQKAVDGLLRVSSAAGPLMQKIRDKVEPETIVFITGVGKCYPLLRSHNLLNNLHLAFDSNPVVLFYPGEYSGQQLTLFNRIQNDCNYYRAFRFD